MNYKIFKINIWNNGFNIKRVLNNEKYHFCVRLVVELGKNIE